MTTQAPHNQVATVLTVAGSDPSGGAGIQADLKTFCAIGVYGGAVITSLTIQNTQGVQGIFPLPPELVKAQLCAVLDDLDVSHIKIGMVGSLEVAGAIGEALEGFTGEVIYDPVLRATSGKSLLEQDDLSALGKLLISHATVLTPNLPELALLTNRTDKDRNDTEAANILFDRYPKLRALVVTGGHAHEEAETLCDRLLLRTASGRPLTEVTQKHPRVATTNSHGTGCTLASAFTAFHQQTNDYAKAFEGAVSFVHRLLEQSSRFAIGHGNGPLLHHLWNSFE